MDFWFRKVSLDIMWLFTFQLLSRDERNLFFDDDEDEMEMQVIVNAECPRDCDLLT